MDSAKLNRFLATIIGLVGGAGIVATLPLLSHTIDEPIHIACGLEWIQDSQYTYERQHPPLSRIAAAVGPAILDANNVRKDELLSKNPAILYSSPSYERTLASARLGELPFYFLMCWVVWSWSVFLYSHRAALIAVALIASTPSILAHAGLATTDISLTSLLVFATYRYWVWISQPATWRATLLLSTAIGLGCCSKFTFLLFFPLCAVAVTALSPTGNWVSKTFLKKRLRHAFVAAGATFMVVWAFYFFRVDSFPTTEGPGGLIEHLPRLLRRLIQSRPVLSMPLGAYYQGIVEVRLHDYHGHPAFLFGEYRRFGWWYFFPVVFALKTPIPFLAAVLLALAVVVKLPKVSRIPIACAILIMISVLPSKINIGIRHILPIYPFLAIAAAGALDWALARSGAWPKALVTGLIAWQLLIAVKAWPDYLPYFNALAGNAPEEIRIDSDLDWGQDVIRVANWWKEKGLEQPLGFGFFASASPTDHGLNWYRLSPWKPSTGWMAVSATELKMTGAERPEGLTTEPWWWLQGKRPVERLGGTLIYYVAPKGPTSP